MIYVEDYLENLVGLVGHKKYDIEKSDITFLSSIARQVFKEVGLTDRQHNAVKEKLLKYKHQFETFNEKDLDNLRTPLRQIDRSQYIRIVSHSDGPGYDTDKEKWLWIKIRFPFNKKTILVIDDLKFKLVGPNDYSSTYSNGYYHKKGTHEHYFRLSERTAFYIIDVFKDKNFDLDSDLLTYYDQIKTIADNPEQHIPGVYNYELRNIAQNAKDALTKELGELNVDTLMLYKDRSLLYDLRHFDEDDLSNSTKKLSALSQKIINRKNNLLFVDKNNWSLNLLLDSITELTRFPLLVILDEDRALDQLSEIHQHLRNIIDTKNISVLFRLDNKLDEQIAFNQYVKNNGLNNSVDNNTEVVYINKSKVPKPLIRSSWIPRCVLSPSSVRAVTKTHIYETECDLAIHYDEQISPYYEYRRGVNKIEKI